MFESMLAKLVLLLLVSTALVTTGVAAKKATSDLYAASIPKQGIDIQPTPAEPTITPTVIPTTTPAPTMEPLVTKTTVTSGKCLITLFGVQYDVTVPNKAHAGGDIFNCGRDMSVIYKTKHGTDVSRMAQFLVVKPTAVATNLVVVSPTLTPIPTVTAGVSPKVTPRPTTKATPTPTKIVSNTYKFEDDHEEREDRANEGRYVGHDDNDD